MKEIATCFYKSEELFQLLLGEVVGSYYYSNMNRKNMECIC